MNADLASTLDAAGAFIRRYVVLSEAQLVASTLWTAHTHAIEAAEQSPYLSVTSATKRSGKTRLFDALELIVARPWRVISPSEAVTFRKLSADRPTLLLDEIDAIWSGNGADNREGLRAVLNAGNRRGTVVPRCAGANGTLLVDFHIFGAKALAGIGLLPETVADRSIPIRLRRKTPTEAVARFRQREADEAAEPIRISLASIMEMLAPELADARPDLPDELDDRAQDGWEPLLAIADAAGGDWPARARAAAVELLGERDDENAIPLRLLADIRTVFEAKEVDRIATAALLEALAEDDEAPWATWHKGERMRPRALAGLLRPFDVRSTTFRVGEATPRGYLKEDFMDAWKRYLAFETAALPLHSGLEVKHPKHPSNHAGLSDVYASKTNANVSDTQTPLNPFIQADVSDVLLRNPNLERNGSLEPGDVGYLDVVRAAYDAGDISPNQYREQVAIHGRNGSLEPGDVGYLEVNRAAFRAGDITPATYREQIEAHGLARRAAELRDNGRRP